MFFMFHITSAAVFFLFFFANEVGRLSLLLCVFFAADAQTCQNQHQRPSQEKPSIRKVFRDGNEQKKQQQTLATRLKYPSNSRLNETSLAFNLLMKLLRRRDEIKEIVASIEAVEGVDPIPPSFLHVSVVFSS